MMNPNSRYLQFRLFGTMKEPAGPDTDHVRWGASPWFKVVIIHVICCEFHHLLPVKFVKIYKFYIHVHE